MPLQLSRTFRGLVLGTCYARLFEAAWRPTEQAWMLAVEFFGNSSTVGAGRLETATYAFSGSAYTQINNALQAGTAPMTVFQAALKTLPDFAGAIDV